MNLCQTLRLAVLISLALSVSGMILLLAAETMGQAMPFTQASLLLVLSGIGVLGAAFLAAVLPGHQQRFSRCEH